MGQPTQNVGVFGGTNIPFHHSNRGLLGCQKNHDCHFKVVRIQWWSIQHGDRWDFKTSPISGNSCKILTFNVKQKLYMYAKTIVLYIVPITSTV